MNIINRITQLEHKIIKLWKLKSHIQALLSNQKHYIKHRMKRGRYLKQFKTQKQEVDGQLKKLKTMEKAFGNIKWGVSKGKKGDRLILVRLTPAEYRRLLRILGTKRGKGYL